MKSIRTILAFVILVYLACYVWPTPWRYDKLGLTPVRWNRVTGRVQFLNLHGWNEEIPYPEDGPVAGK